ncbi:MAG: histidine phosphatase family protein [Acidimicrobiales bacterium]
MTATVWLVRHGQTDWSRSGRHTGRSDVPLDDEGRAQAASIGSYLLTAVALPSLVLTSPLSRASETCRLAGMGGRAEYADDLREWDYGDYEGLTTPEIRDRRPGWDLWTDGVPGGEDAAQVAGRAERVIERCREVGGEVVCFAHGHLLRVLAARWIGLAPAAGRLLALGAGAVSVLGWEREVPIVYRWNLPPWPAPGAADQGTTVPGAAVRA